MRRLYGLMQNWLTLATTAISWRRRLGLVDECWVQRNGAGSIASMLVQQRSRPTMVRANTRGRAHMDSKKINLSEKLATFSDYFSPRTVARLNEYDVMVVKVKGEFVWHKHDETDDFFLV